MAFSQLLRPFPQYTGVTPFRKPQANSLYHSFTLRVEKRFSHGLNLLASLTAGKLIDDASQVVTFLGAHGVKAPDKVGKGRFGNSNFNVKDPDGHTVEIVQ